MTAQFTTTDLQRPPALTIDDMTRTVLAYLIGELRFVQFDDNIAYVGNTRARTVGDEVQTRHPRAGEIRVTLDKLADTSLPVTSDDIEQQIEHFGASLAAPLASVLAARITQDLYDSGVDDALFVSVPLPVDEGSVVMSYKGVYLRGQLRYDIARKQSVLAFDVLYGIAA
ncbi:hypothetical protein QNA24_30055 [Rhodococcus qingshengii]|uniref:hypothetical protein n=1 Tax=Rhodococcus TaxID=1827 RepID=UPI001E4C6F33|nr:MULTISPECIES: hypothetical protein [Rhodococcus]MCD2099614.1 hypothetical protein [Rhodococcus rhodochrous]MCD2123982.1 hypothetical protein [Rhodococcus rhodochrous]MCQ4136586.1 hypothetical protein [Rhodococcus rhodochrous]MDJ0490628.1 hypothetical protein [Rhodococcus qingshengii]